MLENRMLIDSEWGESEYGVPLPRKRDRWEEEDMDDERYIQDLRESECE